MVTEASTVYLRNQISCKRGRDMVYRSGRHMELSALDDALVQCLIRGYSDLNGLAEAMAKSGFGEAPAYWRGKIQEVARARDSVLKIRREPQRAPAELIVVQVTPNQGEVDGLALLRSLGAGVQAWFVTASSELAAKAKRLATVIEAKEFANGFEFVQWTKALAGRFPTTPVLACGELDAVCIGEASERGNVLVALGANWPGGVGAFQLDPQVVHRRGDPAILEEYVYAALTADAGWAMSTMHRSMCSALGVAELWAITGARRVFYRRRSQAEVLTKMGVSDARLEILSAPMGPTRRDAALARDGFLVLAEMPRDDLATTALASLAAAVVDSGAARFAAAYDGSQWYRLAGTGEAVHVLHWIDARPALEDFDSVLAVPNRLNDWSTMAQAVAAGCRLRLATDAGGHPLLAQVPSGLCLRGEPRDWLTQLTDVGEKERLAGDLALLASRWSLQARIREALQAAANTETQS